MKTDIYIRAFDEATGRWDHFDLVDLKPDQLTAFLQTKEKEWLVSLAVMLANQIRVDKRHRKD